VEGSLVSGRLPRREEPLKMKYSFKFSNLCGTVYKSGNLLFTADGNSLLSPVGNKITCFDLVGCVRPAPAA
jgi:hypothetical protein